MGLQHLHNVLLQEKCTTSYMPLARNALKIKGESLKKCQEMLYNVNQKGIIKKWNKVELRFLCTELPVIARNIHAKFGVI